MNNYLYCIIPQIYKNPAVFNKKSDRYLRDGFEIQILIAIFVAETQQIYISMAKIKVRDTEITVVTYEEKDYISLTDMVRNIENGLSLIEKWLRNKNTIEFLGIWEEMYNPDFNSPEFEGIKNEAGLNRFILSVKQW